ncbi:MAG: hypothetical protein R3F30_15400 [Planctomycetota bacterium]
MPGGQEAATRSHWDNWVGNWVRLDCEAGKMLESPRSRRRS